jgi:hypothetical protein
MRFINKIPLFSFVKANYSGDYNWQKSSNAFQQDIGIPDLGTVQKTHVLIGSGARKRTKDTDNFLVRSA